MQIIEHIISIIAPHACLLCSAEGSLLCKACIAKVPTPAPRCYRCRVPSEGGRTCPVCAAASPLASVHAAASYKGAAKQLVWQLKFNRASDAARTIAIMCDMTMSVPHDTVVVYVPTANSRVRLRGYDQAQRIAHHLSRIHHLPCPVVLARISNTRQVGANALKRRAQLETAFRIIRPYAIKNRHVLLIDDVITTGSSLEACARELIAAGATDVRAIVFARA